MDASRRTESCSMLTMLIGLMAADTQRIHTDDDDDNDNDNDDDQNKK